ncbi:MAG TPA: ABC transporter substrate-binding protein [Rectinema sp.]|jgi:NitT/TauT family transport system substrate-binding protein|nr:ABC transporter substrate-binding protein [Spirochaetia bacterium]MDI9426466.1 ABC transporter substrate-binding protein [Spirochaetota bacterium]OQC75196.1 MAG: ABC transporter, phosphonate, periplasmic substrate-binding protein [Spirochaetes bacterium ADurb.Bin001]HNP92560.1 ABC transporter substrate-binding protein [Rectinema sp.]HNT58759.1 ABC transporter substrate-binding protein [Rectinema sp.]
MKRSKISLVATLLLAVSVFILYASPKDKIAVSVIRGPSGLSSTWMMSELARTSPSEFEFISVAGADMVVAKLLNGEIDAGVLPVNVAAKLYNTGAPIRALAVVGNGMVKFLTTDTKVQSLADCKGKTIYIAGQKATPDYIFQFLCAQKGLQIERDYTAIYSLAYPEIAAGLAGGKISYAVLPEPFASQAILKNPAIRTPIDITKEWQAATDQPDYPMSLFVARKEMIEAYPDKARILLDSYRASINKAIEDPQLIAKLAENLDLGVNAQTAIIAIPKSNFVFVEAYQAIPSIEALLSVFLKFDPASVGGVLPSKSFYAQIK